MTPIATASVESTDVHYRHDVLTGSHSLIADEPAERGGADAGPAPYDYLLAALGACTAITLRMYAEHKGWELGGFRVELIFLKDAGGNARIDRILHSTGALDEAQWARLLEVAEKTPVTLTIKTGTSISTRRQS